jgi:hypothetical protein
MDLKMKLGHGHGQAEPTAGDTQIILNENGFMLFS